jgi:hypothetical protein
MRTKRYRLKKRRKTTTTIKRKTAKRNYRGGNNYAIEQLRQVPTDKYIPFGGESYNHFDYPNLAEGVGMQTYTKSGGRSKRNTRSSSSARSRRLQPKKKSFKRKDVRGGGLSAIIPQQIINTGRGISSFFTDKVNSYQGYPLASSYLPYKQPIDNLHNAEVISLY